MKVGALGWLAAALFVSMPLYYFGFRAYGPRSSPSSPRSSDAAVIEQQAATIQRLREQVEVGVRRKRSSHAAVRAEKEKDIACPDFLRP